MTTTNTPIATLNAEFVNEFEFVKRTERERHSSNMVVTHPYTRNYEAKVSVKIGNAVKELVFKSNSHYISSSRNEAGEWIPSRNFEFLGLDEDTHPFEELEAAGLHVDYSEAQYQYERMVGEAKYRETLITRFAKWEHIRNAKKHLANSWIHGFATTIKADRNKKIVEAVKETKFAVSKDFENKHHVRIEYKGVYVYIHKVDGSFSFNNEKYEYGMHPTSVETGNNVELAEGKLRRAKREGTLFLKAIEAIDERNASVNYKKNARATQVKETEIKRLDLEKVTGYPVIMEESRAYSRDRNSNASWMTQKYFLLLKQPENSYTSYFDRIKISSEKSYGKDAVKSYTVEGIGNLRPEQMRGIVEILLAGRKPLPKMIRPKEKN